MKRFLPIISVVLLLSVLISCNSTTNKTVICNSCGEKISSLSNFCQFCGTSLKIQGNPNDDNTDDSKNENEDDSQSDESNSNDTNNDNENSEKLDDSTLIKKLIKVYGLQMKTDYGEGVDVYVDWENLSEKEIKYMHFKIKLYNRVGDDITGEQDKWISQTGPIPQGKGMYNSSGNDGNVAYRPFRPKLPYSECKNDEANGWEGKYWDSVWYNSEAYCVKIVGVKIEYMDGSSFIAVDESFSDILDYHWSWIGDYFYDFSKTTNN